MYSATPGEPHAAPATPARCDLATATGNAGRREGGERSAAHAGWLDPIEHSTLAARVRRSLRDALTMGEIEPGERLHPRALAEGLGVSQTPVREAILQLVAERALVFNPNRSVTVPRLTGEEYVELRDIRVALEGQASRLAAREATPRAVAELASLHRRMLAAARAGDHRGVLRLNRDVHFGAYRLSGRPQLVALIESLWIRTGPYLNLLFRKAGPERGGPHAHEVLIAALRAGDAPGAERAIADDIRVGGDVILAVLAEEHARRPARGEVP